MKDDKTFASLVAKLNKMGESGEPKKIIWYPTRHRKVPQDQVYAEAIRWFKQHL